MFVKPTLCACSVCVCVCVCVCVSCIPGRESDLGLLGGEKQCGILGAGLVEERIHSKESLEEG